MMFLGSRRSDTEYLFIDGGCLRAAVKKICKENFGNENEYKPHIPGLLRINRSFHKVFYYDAVPGKERGEKQLAYEARVQADHERFEKIQSLDLVHVALGNIVGNNRRQKGVDVRLAVDMMTHAFRGNMSRATLFAADADFVPLVRALVTEGLQVTLWHPQQANAELKGAADTTRLFDFTKDYGSFSADEHQPAFRLAESGGSLLDPSPEELGHVEKVDGRFYAGTWRSEMLKIWFRGPHTTWNFATYHMPGSTLPRALEAFQAIEGHPIAATGPLWIHVQDETKLSK